MARPLSDLIRTNGRLIATTVSTSQTYHVTPGINKEFTVTCAVLEQTNEHGQIRPVACMSNYLNKHDKNYPEHEKELLTLIRAIGK